MGPVSIGVEVQRNTVGDTPSIPVIAIGYWCVPVFCCVPVFLRTGAARVK